MKSVFRRIVCAVLVLLLLPIGLLQMPIPVYAAYENTYKNTGDQRSDLIGVALTQVGYREGSGGYTKYGAWYGSSYMAWCGAFVSWCANQAGIPTSVIKKNGFASASLFGITDTFNASTRLPQPGDLFFKNNGNHTGIVYYVEGNYFYTLEGNTWEGNDYDGVYIRKRNLYDAYYFGAPKYQSGVNHNYAVGVEDSHPHKQFYKCADCGDTYYTGKTATVDTCKECIMANCKHNYGSFVKKNENSHTATCSLCGKVDALNHQWKDVELIATATCKQTGSKRQVCTDCSESRVTVIAKTNDHQYGPWTYVNQQSHMRTCKTCSREQVKSHTMSDWQSDPFAHWYECQDCHEQASFAEHEYSEESCESQCTVCEYQHTVGHIFSRWCYDQDNHWQECANCPQIGEAQPHQFSSACDSSCDSCGYTREVTHDYSQAFTGDSTGHWRTCKQCNAGGDVMEHHFDGDNGSACTDCGYVPAQAVFAHSHTFRYQSSADAHWGSCQCGETLEPVGHIWDMQTGSCKICGMDVPQAEEPAPFPWLIVLPCVGLTFGGTALVMALLKLRKRRFSHQLAHQLVEV